ncbi:MAG: hypothetical protein Kapaf2KO_22230 [Candidatus Kapaibacteriales bacterium]
MRKSLALLTMAILAMVMFSCKSNKSESEEASNSSVPSGYKMMENGVYYKDVKMGAGKTVEKGDKLEVHYVGTFPDGAKFDSSKDRSKTFEFTNGQNGIIEGWSVGTVGMKEGGIRKIILEPSMAYGNRKVGTIPPNSTLHFEIELIDIKSK